MDGRGIAAPSPAPMIASLVATSSGSSVAIIIAGLLIIATIMAVLGFCVWMCGCKPVGVLHSRAGGAISSSSSSSSPSSKPGMSKQVIESRLPAMGYSAAAALLASVRRSSKNKEVAAAAEAAPVVELGCCSICLAEFGKQDQSIRVIPGCGHCFHSECIALWLVAHSSCPVCRRNLIASTHLQHCCKNCGRITTPRSPPPPPPPHDLSFSAAVVCYSTSQSAEVQQPVPSPLPETRTIRLQDVVIEVPADELDELDRPL